jgi:hypothetical protein
MVWGVTFLWNLMAVTLLGLWVMAAPDVFEVARQVPASSSNHLVGALIVVVAVIAWAEILRPVRFLNVLLGAWIVIGAWLLSGGNLPLAVSNTLVGIVVIALSIPQGSVRERYGTWDRYIT